MDLLENAVKSIELGVDDYRTGTHARLLSAVRNIHAGILLLYKEALRRLSPSGSNDVLMREKMVPKRDTDGNILFEGDGKKTAGVWQIQQRFAALKIATDWERFGRINKIRNDVEHFYPQLDKKAFESVIADSFVLVRNFVATELEDDPQALLNDETWRTMLEITEVHDAEKAECLRLLESCDWQSETLRQAVLDLECANYGADLLRPDQGHAAFSYDTELRCRSCGETEDAESFVPRAIDKGLSWKMYLSVMNGDRVPYASCPECSQDTYVASEWRCALCGHKAALLCARCSVEIPIDELESAPLCGWCEHMVAKDD